RPGWRLCRTAPGEKKTARQHANDEFRQPYQRIEAEDILPEEVRFARIDFVQAVGMHDNVAKRKAKAQEAETEEGDEQLPFRDLAKPQQKKWKNKIEESFDGEAPTNRVPGKGCLRNPGL